MRTFGEMIKESRVKLGYTMENVAKIIESQKGYISGIETGKVNAPSVRIIKKLAKCLRLDENFMILTAWIEKAPKEIRPAIKAKADVLASSVEGWKE